MKKELIENYGSFDNAARTQANYLHAHGLFDAADMIDVLMKERNQLLEALKLLHSNFKSQHQGLLFLGAPDFVYMDNVATKAIADAEDGEHR